jgi:hypothetical protein
VSDDGLERIAAGYRSFVEEAVGSSPSYAELAGHVAGNREVLRFLAVLQVSHGAAPQDGAALSRMVVDDGGLGRSVRTGAGRGRCHGPPGPTRPPR